jgi:hypothetical protein
MFTLISLFKRLSIPSWNLLGIGSDMRLYWYVCLPLRYFVFEILSWSLTNLKTSWKSKCSPSAMAGILLKCLDQTYARLLSVLEKSDCTEDRFKLAQKRISPTVERERLK